MTDLSMEDLLGPDPEPADELVPAAELAAWLGLSSGRVSELARDGILPRQSVPGGYGFPLKDSVRTYAEYLRKRAGQRSGSEQLAAEKLRLASEQADKLAIQNAKARGDLIPAAKVRAEWLNIAADLRARLLAVPSRVAAKLGFDRSAAAALDAELRLAMTILTEADEARQEAAE